MKRFAGACIVLVLALSAVPASGAQAKAQATGIAGQVLTADKSSALNPQGSWVTVTGRNFDERIGIYVTYCQVVPKGVTPTPCGSGIDVTGKTHTSVWVSSNAPFFLRSVTTDYAAGGKFKVRIKIYAKTKKLNCLKVKCAITTRSDHLNLDSHVNDVFIPISFAKKGTK